MLAAFLITDDDPPETYLTGATLRLTREVTAGVPLRTASVSRCRVVELLLHVGHVGVGGLHDQPRPGAELRIGSDIAVDHDHVGLGDMGVLDGRDAVIFGPGNGLSAGVGGVVDDVGGPGATRVDAGLNRDVSELG